MEVYEITGYAGKTPYDDLTLDHIGKKVIIWRKCMNQDTTICETEDGSHLWVENEGLTRVDRR